MTTRLGLHNYDVFEYYLLKANGFIQGLLEDIGFMVPHHELTLDMPASLSTQDKYKIYEMYTSFVRTHLVMNPKYYISVSDGAEFFTLRVMEYFKNEELARCRHKQLDNFDVDFYNLSEFQISSNTLELSSIYDDE